MARIGTDIHEAIRLLKQSEVIGIPTETVYGLAGNAFDADAVAKIFAVENRPTFDPLIVHTSSADRLRHFVEEMPPVAEKLAAHFWPGPMTVVLKKKPLIPDLVTSGLDTVAVRVPSHPLALELLKSIDFPLAAPSANPFGYVSPTNAHHVEEQLGERISYILDGGDCAVGLESTIVAFEDNKTVVLRLGGTSIEDIEKVVGKVEVRLHATANPSAPGMLESHYSPMTPMAIGDIRKLINIHRGKKTGVLSFSEDYSKTLDIPCFILSKSGDMAEAATRLFSGLRQLDALHLHIIVSELVPEEGLGRAINDRLRRAAIKRN
ncbi:MAG: L-threonylcarbamoyladenylate synthase [Cyclobacteriaceae bacterium]|nr:L-threonylcarbamoyladenylate synthase [Cyclobacteriaceae bacterium]